MAYHFNPKKHDRRSIRLKGYDYAQPGAYFITICVQDKKHLFGEIHEGQMFLNDAGIMIEKWYSELAIKYPDKKCHEMVVMPNHFHCIIENLDVAHSREGTHVGAPLRGRPTPDERGRPTPDERGRPVPDERGRPVPDEHEHPHPEYGMQNQKFNATIGDTMDWFKTMTTNEYICGVKQFGWERFNRKLWQRNYWEHIIRHETAYNNIARYIINNPQNWHEDRFY
ncbi:transposase [Haliscomenobacter sp.]|uniref:transposase n=1 Tax=Haliscomenobacter sp. TaxID=2717303 RepID=UPI003593C77C